jgi:hypothetical protein
MLFPFRFQLFNGKPFEEFFLSFKVGFKGREEKTFTETAWTAQKVWSRCISYFPYKLCLIYV